MRFWSGIIVFMLAAALAVPAAIAENYSDGVGGTAFSRASTPGSDCRHTGQAGELGKVKPATPDFRERSVNQMDIRSAGRLARTV